MQAITDFIANNALVAFIVICAVYAIGDFLGTYSKAWIPSTFVIACLFLVGYWTFFPQEIVSIAGLSKPLTSVLCIYMITTHLGTTISFSELKKQWKVIVVCLLGLSGLLLSGWFIAGLFVERDLIIAGLPPLAGGLIAALTMQTAAQEAGFEVAAILAIAMYSVQGFVGYPLTALCLKKEGKRLLDEFRSGKGEAAIATEEAVIAPKRKLFQDTPQKYFSTAVALLKVALVGLLAMYISIWTANWGYFKISGTVACLIMGILFTELGFLEKNILQKSGCLNFLIFALMLYIFDGLKGASVEIMSAAILPMAILIAIGVVGMAVVAYFAAKPLKMRPFMAIAVNLTSLYGFPPNLILTEEASKALAETEEERQYLMDKMLPQMIVGGFVTVTITSVIIAGIFANFF